MANEMVTLPATAIPALRKMIAIGMASLAELERLDERLGKDAPKGARPVHPTGAHEMGEFASALMWLDQAAPVES